MPIDLDLTKKPGLFIAGTDIGVGKTLIAGAIARILAEQNLRVGVFKPIAVGCQRQWEGMVSDEAEFLCCCANSDLSLSTVTPVGYTSEDAPFICALQEKRPIDFDKIASAYEQICQNCDIVVVEGTGGVRVPLTEEYDLLDLAAVLKLPVVIVAKVKPSVINHTLMTIDCVRAAQLKIAGVVINGLDATRTTQTSETYRELIKHFSAVDVMAVLPYDETVDKDELSLGELIVPVLSECNWAKLAHE
ncbi:MAG: dethiobiotin synthase [Sedimentisphaerales bacterium]|nr:dethiobiotin synthase [Sedimentisphaerales bacterium]